MGTPSVVAAVAVLGGPVSAASPFMSSSQLALGGRPHPHDVVIVRGLNLACL
jgi:hypothetical protein